MVRQHLHDPRWDEPILLGLGFVGLDSPDDASELVETAILAQGEQAEEVGFQPSPYEELLGRDYLFALRCLGDQIPIDAALMRQLLQRLASERLHSTGLARFTVYELALDRRLSYLRGSNAEHLLLPHLLGALKDADSYVRGQAATSLGQLGAGSAEVASALLAALKDADRDVRKQAARSLGQLAASSAEVVSVLLTALKDDHPEVRRQAAKSLEEVGQGEETVLQALWNGLLDTEHEVRTTCTQALVRFGFRLPERKNTIEKMLVQAIQDPAFDKLSSIYKRTGHGYAFDGLWQLVVGSEEGEESS